MDMKSQVIEELIDHLKMMQGDGLKETMDESLLPEVALEESPVEVDIESISPDGSVDEEIEVMPEVAEEGMLGSEQELTDEEIEELLKNL